MPKVLPLPWGKMSLIRACGIINFVRYDFGYSNTNQQIKHWNFHVTSVRPAGDLVRWCYTLCGSFGYSIESSFQAVGAAAIGLGIWVLLENASVLELSSLKELSIMDQSYLLTSIYLVITAGAAILVFGIVGIVAANSQSACCLGFVSFISHIYTLTPHF